MKIADLPSVVRRLKDDYNSHRAPIMELVAEQTNDPFRVLVGTILSARTKDACTAGACHRLFAKATTPEELDALSEEEVKSLIYPVGFSATKARMLKRLPSVLRERFGGVLPDDVESLCELPGVGRKTANLVVALGFNKPAICVDVHVHRISNRFGLISTQTPLETEMTLRRILPVRYWQTWNSYLVAFGQTRCSPRNPKCQGCPIVRWCDYGATRVQQAPAKGRRA